MLGFSQNKLFLTYCPEFSTVICSVAGLGKVRCASANSIWCKKGSVLQGLDDAFKAFQGVEWEDATGHGWC